MKTVCVFADVRVGQHEIKAFEHTVFGPEEQYKTASEFISECQKLWKPHKYQITKVVIEG